MLMPMQLVSSSAWHCISFVNRVKFHDSWNPLTKWEVWAGVWLHVSLWNTETASVLPSPYQECMSHPNIAPPPTPPSSISSVLALGCKENIMAMYPLSYMTSGHHVILVECVGVRVVHCLLVNRYQFILVAITRGRQGSAQDNLSGGTLYWKYCWKCSISSLFTLCEWW